MLETINKTLEDHYRANGWAHLDHEHNLVGWENIKTHCTYLILTSTESLKENSPLTEHEAKVFHILSRGFTLREAAGMLERKVRGLDDVIERVKLRHGYRTTQQAIYELAKLRVI